METMHGNLWGTLILLSLWSGNAGELRVCLDRKQVSSGPCKVELTCSTLSDSAVEWFRGGKKVINDQRHGLRFGGMMLDVTLDSQLGETAYTCKEVGAGVEQTVDLGQTCGYGSNIKIRPDDSAAQYQKVKIILTAIFLAVYAAALLITFYLCRQQNSNNEKKRKHNKEEEGIYSDLLSPETQPDTKEQLQATGKSRQGKPKESSQLTVEVETEPAAAGVRTQGVTGPSTGSIREQAEAGPSTGSIREQAEAGPSAGSIREQTETRSAASLRRQAESGPSSGSIRELTETRSAASVRRQAESGPSSGSIRVQTEAGSAANLQMQDEAKSNPPQVVPEHDPTYTSLMKRPKDAEYQLLTRQESAGQSAVTYSAEAEEVTLKTTL